MPARRKSPRRSPRRSKGSRSKSPRRSLKRRSSGKARTSRRAAVRRSPKRRTYKGTRLYGSMTGASTDGTASGGSGGGPPGDGPGKRVLGDGEGAPSKKPRADVPTHIQKLLDELEGSEEGQKQRALAQVRTLLQFMAEDAVKRAIESAKEMMNAAHNLLALQYGENAELIYAFFPIQPPLDLEEDSGDDSEE